jgi:hypothetical protein
VVVRGPSCILEGALRFASALFGEGRDRWNIVREKLTHAVDLADSPCTWEESTDFIIGFINFQENLSKHRRRRNLRERKDTPYQSGTTVIEATFLFDPDKQVGSDGDLWLHEDCGSRPSAEHDLGRIVISEKEISGMRSGFSRTQKLKAKLDISEEGLLFRDPILEMGCGTQIPITWESSNLSLSNNNGMDNVRVQLADEMKTLHST